MHKSIDGRLVRLEAAQRATLPDVWPAYLVGVDLDDLARKVQALPPGARRITGYVTVSPDDWECIDDESNG